MLLLASIKVPNFHQLYHQIHHQMHLFMIHIFYKKIPYGIFFIFPFTVYMCNEKILFRIQNQKFHSCYIQIHNPEKIPYGIFFQGIYVQKFPSTIMEYQIRKISSRYTVHGYIVCRKKNSIWNFFQRYQFSSNSYNNYMFTFIHLQKDIMKYSSLA